MSAVMLSNVLASKYDDDGFLCVQVQAFGTKGRWYRLSNSHGQQSRPVDPDAEGNACQVFYWEGEGDQGYAILANDPRAQDALPQSQKGETFFHGPTGAFLRFKADGSISLFTTDDNTTNGRSVALIVSPTGLSFQFPFGRLTFDGTGFHVLHNSGARIDLGAIAAPAPLDALGSYATLSAAMVHVEGSAVHVGTAGGAPQPVALANSVLALCNALNGVLTAIGSPGGIVAPPSGGPCTAGPALVTALATAASAIATATVGATPTPGAVASLSSTATGSV